MSPSATPPVSVALAPSPRSRHLLEEPAPLRECHAVRTDASVIRGPGGTVSGCRVTTVDETPLSEHPVAAILVAYQVHAASAYAVARRVTHDHELAVEAVQEAFLCLWRTHAKYQADRGEIGPYLHTIVRRRAIDLVRQAVRYPRPIALHLVAEQLQPAESGPEDHVCRNDEADKVRAAIDALPPQRRKPLVLAYYGGLTRQEIAWQLGLPLGTVKTRILAAKRQLRTALDEGGVRGDWCSGGAAHP